MKLFQVTAKHYCAGVVVQAGRVVQAAPILRLTLGRWWDPVESYLLAHGATVVWVREREEPGRLSPQS